MEEKTIWIKCPKCGHKLMRLIQRGDGRAPNIEIKCSSCKTLVKLSDDAFIPNDPPTPNV